MLTNSNLIQTFLGQGQEVAKTAESSNMLVPSTEGGVTEFSKEFLSLLNETKAMAQSGVSPQEFIETLGTEDLGLSSEEKKTLAKSFMNALEGSDLVKSEVSTSSAEIVKAPTGETLKNSPELAKILGHEEIKTPVNKTVINNTLNNTLKNISSEGEVTGLENKVIGQKTSEETLEVVNPKITNGKLISLKEHATKKPVQSNFQSSQDFIDASKVVENKESEAQQIGERKSFFPNSKNKVLAFNKEQNLINNNVFAGKNPFTTSTEVATSKAKLSSEASLEGILSTNQSAEVIAPMMAHTQGQSSEGQNLFGNNNAVKVLDFSNINSTNSAQLIDKISNYITTSRLENQDHVELLVKHDSLGHIKVTATKGQLPDQINLDIVANSDKGHHFFKSNEVEMIKSLSNSGVKLNDVKISMGGDFNLQSSDKGDSQFNQGHSSQHSRHNGQASSGHEQNRRDRREQMWDMYRERLGA
ncbi:hypothetical protein [Halobacteriovorax marinus]|uniref:hypothetical protein n=1 Tax=Halobacteriovorax marinus TaxID=97084 RepID=UPI003A8CF235